MCYLRGILMLKLGRPESAKTCFMEALSLDVKCYEAFDQLTGGELMTVDEGVYREKRPCEFMATNCECRMGIYARAPIQRTDCRGFRIYQAHLYVSFTEIQTR